MSDNLLRNWFKSLLGKNYLNLFKLVLFPVIMQNLREMEIHPGQLVLRDNRRPQEENIVPGISLHVFDRFNHPTSRHQCFFARDSASICPVPELLSGLDKLSKLINFPEQIADIGRGNYGLIANRHWIGNKDVSIGLRDLGQIF
tara:strand:- start:31 stop:462 length:432 start_codon:yes stop_codon:yes gene_type:complete